jgi:DNA-binding GntR family transcriptional regulator
MTGRPDAAGGEQDVRRPAWEIVDPFGSRVHRTERARILDALRDRILSGVLAPGGRIDLDATAAEFGTSRTPVREACLALDADGLVRVAQRSGITVVGLSEESILENFAVMAALSGVAAQWAARRASPLERARIREIHREIAAGLQVGNDVSRLNWEFHGEINKACGSRRLREMLAAAARMIPQRFFELFPGHIADGMDEHEALVAAIEQGRELEARRLAEQHFESAIGVLREHFAEQSRVRDS